MPGPLSPHAGSLKRLPPVSLNSMLGLQVCSPERVHALSHTRVRFVAAGNDTSMVIDDTGRLYSWGSGGFGCLGHGSDRRSEKLPRMVCDVSVRGVTRSSVQWKMVVCGWRHCIAVSVEGDAYTWGSSEGLGQGEGCGVISIPTMVQSLPPHAVASISAGRKHSLVCAVDGSVWVCGSTEHSQGNGYSYFSPIDGLGGCVMCASGSTHNITLHKDGTVRVWGGNDYGQLGLGDSRVGKATPIPSLIPSFTGYPISTIGCGQHHSIFVGMSGVVMSCGMGGQGQLGVAHPSLPVGDISNRSIPDRVEIMGVDDVV